MKAQSYFRCENCGKIAATDLGNRLAACSDCGSENLKILVPVDDEAKVDPLSDRKKTAMAVLIGLAGIAAVTVFLLFGRLLQDYIAFDAKRETAEKAHERLATEIQAKEATLATLSKKASEELLQVSENAKHIETTASFAKAALVETEAALHRTRMALSNETAKVIGAQTQLDRLEEEWNRIRKKVDALAAEEAQLVATVGAAMTRTNRLVSDVAAAEKAQTSANAELAKALTTLDTAYAARDKVREEAQALAVRVRTLAERQEALEEDIRDKQKVQTGLEASIAELKNQHGNFLSEMNKARAALDSLIASRDKTREEADTQSARLAVLKAEVATLEKAKAGAEKVKGELGR